MFKKQWAKIKHGNYWRAKMWKYKLKSWFFLFENRLLELIWSIITALLPLCRLCETRIKTVDHIVSGCGKLARTNNTIIILQDSELEVLGMFSPYRNDTSPAHDPGLFTENKEMKLLLNVDILLNHIISARRPRRELLNYWCSHIRGWSCPM